MSKWHDTDLGMLTVIDAYDAMIELLEAFHERDGKISESLHNLITWAARNETLDLDPIDPAQWEDWLTAVKKIQAKRISQNTSTRPN